MPNTWNRWMKAIILGCLVEENEIAIETPQKYLQHWSIFNRVRTMRKWFNYSWGFRASHPRWQTDLLGIILCNFIHVFYKCELNAYLDIPTTACPVDNAFFIFLLLLRLKYNWEFGYFNECKSRKFETGVVELNIQTFGQSSRRKVIGGEKVLHILWYLLVYWHAFAYLQHFLVGISLENALG